MVFVSFTSVYIVRQGLPTLDDRTGSYVHDWLQVSLPTGLLLINTFLLVLSSVTMELARRQITRQAALAPVSPFPEFPSAKRRNFPWLGVTVVLAWVFWPDNGWPGANWAIADSTWPPVPAVHAFIC